VDGPIFLSKEHNSKTLLMDDCLRCHSMHFQGSIRDLVTRRDHEYNMQIREELPQRPHGQVHRLPHERVPRKMARVAQDRIASSGGFDTGAPNTAQDPLSALCSLALTTTPEGMHVRLPYVS
jgi:hypothetical protein